jgi:hypothetical protein
MDTGAEREQGQLMAWRTRPPQQPIAARFPNLLPLRRVAVRLHPHRVAVSLPPSASKIGGSILWPEEEPWPICTAREFAVEPVTPPDRVALTDLVTGISYGETWVGPEDRRHTGIYLPVLQLRRADVPELPFPGDSDLFQLVWCSRLHEDDYQPRIRLHWRRERDITHPRTSFPRPITTTSDDATVATMSADYLVPLYECAVAPERILEYPSLTALEQMGLIPHDASEDLWDAQNRGELGTAYGGTKVGGWPAWGQEPVELVCPRGHEMHYLLSFETTEPIEDLIVPPEENERRRHGDAREEEAYREPTGMAFGRNGFLYVFWCPHCPDHIARSAMQ